MPIAMNRVYNDPNIGAAMSNLAGMFAPPDSADLANYALAAERKQKASQLAELFSSAGAPNFDQTVFDRRNIAVGNYNPTQSFYAQDQNNSTAMRGQDVTAATSRANNTADNTRAFVTDMYGPLNQGQIRPEVPGGISSMFGIPDALPMAEGAPKPLSETEWQAAQNSRLQKLGLLKDEDLLAAVNSAIPVENVVGDGGVPEIVRRSDAVGQQPYFNKGAEAKPENAVAKLRDGTTVPAIQNEAGRWVHAQTGAELPSDIQIFKMPQAQGTAADVGLTNSTDAQIEQQLIDIGVAKDTAVKLRDLIATQPASQGLVGWLRGTAQNVIQTGGELGQFFGGNVAEVAKDIENGLADADLAGSFDPNIPAIDMLANLLAFQYAKTTTGERLSNEMLRAAREALGLNGLDANQANSIARLNQAIAQIESQENILHRVLDNGIGSASTPAGPAPSPTGVPSADGVPPGIDPADWAFMSPEDKALFQ